MSTAHARAAASSSLPNYIVCAADLATTSLEEALSATPWQRAIPAVVVGEGLLMYLHAASVELLAQVREAVAPGSRLASTRS
jgi:O-methyltransferase involved in polyketide biosynthesis